MSKFRVKFRTVRWVKSILWMIKVTIVIAVICSIPIVALSSLDSPVESKALIMIFMDKFFFWFLVFGAGSYFILYILVTYGGIRIYRGHLQISENALFFESKKYRQEILFSDIQKLEYRKDENLKVSWKVFIRNKKQVKIDFLDINERIKADIQFIETLMVRLEIPIIKTIEELPPYGPYYWPDKQENDS